MLRARGGIVTRPRWFLVAGAAVAALVLTGVIALTTASPGRTEPGASPAPSVASNGFAAGALQDPAPAVAAPDHAEPASVRIPSLGVSSSLERLGLGGAGELLAPVDWDKAGWFADGVVPGEIGPAIIAGHVDSPTAPAVFYRLAELQPGDEIVVDTTDGESLTFRVTGSTQSGKSTFPTDEVYSNVPRPELRLITCAGAFDRSIGHYTDNLIVFAALVA
jgi:hypothetical protein